ncbi:PEP-CTERM sorting domain-containing protein [Noviherbaspirillum pedocola]|uniref:PEP-CTERM sorting domain-containing protein n=1 Tax=Noviherbaspirillum pedocola TaxID=2801341 RepID=A0A934SZM0_9BURK|nr:PEP-CTERM sorting domain-containing protein [Noviherbaspirillum pedocola]MBK4738215.1 PEP-CTERM sorting domain-containing protein [Noviherbaspirillum pedocola]
MHVKKLVSAIGLVTAIATGNAVADTITYTGSSASLGASATFDVSGNTLQITLTNTSTADVTNTAQLLTAVFFNINNSPSLSLTGASANLGASSAIYLNGSPQTYAGLPNVGGEWAYGSGLDQYSASYGISSSGLGLFGNPNLNGNNLADPAAVDGPNFGITSAGDDLTTGNQGLNSVPIIQNSVVFNFALAPNSGLTAADFKNVTFQYGTDLSDPHITGDGGGGGTGTNVPEPGMLALLGIGLGALSLRKRISA